jgi:ribosomal RNA-processing protein 9
MTECRLVNSFVADGEFDAAEIDKELISARLKQDVMEHSGKMHIFIADTVRFVRVAPQNAYSIF